MPTMITRSATRKSPKAGLGPWTDPALVEQMAIVKSILQKTPVNLKQLSNQCLLLSKILDSLVANDRKPSHRHDLLPLVQQVCKYKDKPDARPALLLLLLSIKSAFRTDWLSNLEVTGNDEIFATLNLLFDSFTTCDQISTQSSLQALQCGGSAVRDAQESLMFLSTITNRFYPRLHINVVFVAVQAKVGYEILMCDFHVPHMFIQDRVRLYVFRKDSVETATCLITPPQVNFLVNGQQVEKRVTSSYMDGGPQMPSDVTHFVKVGANVLQVIGEFSESHIIAVVSSRTIECSAKNTQLEDYVAPTEAASCEVDPNEVDDEVVEGASRLSLRCPISHQRLVTPVKATACRHLQCFDCDSFLEINEKRPAWRCPCCNRFVSWPDLRIDRHMERILKLTDEKIDEVIISKDGSWAPVSTRENQSNIGADATPIEEGEIVNSVIDLSDIGDEEVKGVSRNIDEFQLPETKPDVQTLQAINENRGNPPQATNSGVANVPDITASARQSSPNFPGPSWTGPSRNEPVHNQPASSAQTLPASNQNIQAPHFQSRTSPCSPAGFINRSAPSSGNMTSTQLQQPQIGIPSNTGVVSRGETGGMRQQQGGQQSLNTPQTQQQWRGQHQLATIVAPFQQQFQSRPSSVSASLHRTPRPTIGSQQMPPRPWGGPPTTHNVLDNASALQQNWRPAVRMRGSIANPHVVGTPVGTGILGPTPFGNPFIVGNPFIDVQYQMRMPPPGNLHTMPPFPRGPRG